MKGNREDMSRYFPLNINVEGKMAVVVGGGKVGARKCKSLLAAGARVRVISPGTAEEITALARRGEIELICREYGGKEDLAGALLVFAATDDAAVNRRICRDAEECGILACCADSPAMGNFITPAAVRRGDLLLTVSTGGKSPALAAMIRQKLEETFGEEYAEALEVLGTARQKLLTATEESAYNRTLLKMLVEDRLAHLVGNDRKAAELLTTEPSEAEDKDPQ